MLPEDGSRGNSEASRAVGVVLAAALPVGRRAAALQPEPPFACDGAIRRISTRGRRIPACHGKDRHGVGALRPQSVDFLRQVHESARCRAPARLALFDTAATCKRGVATGAGEDSAIPLAACGPEGRRVEPPGPPSQTLRISLRGSLCDALPVRKLGRPGHALVCAGRRIDREDLVHVANRFAQLPEPGQACRAAASCMPWRYATYLRSTSSNSCTSRAQIVRFRACGGRNRSIGCTTCTNLP